MLKCTPHTEPRLPRVNDALRARAKYATLETTLMTGVAIMKMAWSLGVNPSRSENNWRNLALCISKAFKRVNWLNKLSNKCNGEIKKVNVSQTFFKYFLLTLLIFPWRARLTTWRTMRRSGVIWPNLPLAYRTTRLRSLPTLMRGKYWFL